MSAHDQKLYPAGASQQASGDKAEPVASSPENNAYYAVLADRLEKLLFDMQKSGTASDDPLMLRLADLLSETRSLLRKSKSR